MDILSIIEVINDEVSSVQSIIISGEDKTECIQRAEKRFKELALQNGAAHEILEDCLDNGNYTSGTYSVSFFWGTFI